MSYSYEKAWRKLWANLIQEEKDKVKTLPNFDADIFSEITGINKEEI